MYTFIITIGIICAILLIVIIFMQNPKNDAVGPMSSSTSQLLGAGRAVDFLEKATWILIIVLFLVSLLSSLFLSDHDSNLASPSVIEQSMPAQPEAAFPVTP